MVDDGMSYDVRPWAGLILGLLLGSAMAQAHTFYDYQALHNMVRQTQVEAQHWHQESLKLRDQIALINRRNVQQTYVQTVNLEVIKSPVPLIDVEAALEPYTEALLGIPLSAVKLTLVYQLFQNRRIVLNHDLYHVNVKALLISPDVSILIHLTKLNHMYGS